MTFLSNGRMQPVERLLSKCQSNATHWAMLQRCIVVSIHIGNLAMYNERVQSESAARDAVAKYLVDMRRRKPDMVRVWAIAFDGQLIDSGIDADGGQNQNGNVSPWTDDIPAA